MATTPVAATDRPRLATKLAALEGAIALLKVALGPLKEDPQRDDDADDACEELNDFACASGPAPWSEVEPLLKRIYFVGGEDASFIAPRLFCDAIGIGLAHKTLMKVQVTSDDSSLRMLFVLRRLTDAVNLRRSQLGAGAPPPTTNATSEEPASPKDVKPSNTRVPLTPQLKVEPRTPSLSPPRLNRRRNPSPSPAPLRSSVPAPLPTTGRPPSQPPVQCPEKSPEKAPAPSPAADPPQSSPPPQQPETSTTFPPLCGNLFSNFWNPGRSLQQPSSHRSSPSLRQQPAQQPASSTVQPFFPFTPRTPASQPIQPYHTSPSTPIMPSGPYRSAARQPTSADFLPSAARPSVHSFGSALGAERSARKHTPRPATPRMKTPQAPDARAGAGGATPPSSEKKRRRKKTFARTWSCEDQVPVPFREKEDGFDSQDDGKDHFVEVISPSKRRRFGAR
ncbi:hypothetical protein JCM6882_004798 [Rhodosporidiobolus microsporus]